MVVEHTIASSPPATATASQETAETPAPTPSYPRSLDSTVDPLTPESTIGLSTIVAAVDQATCPTPPLLRRDVPPGRELGQLVRLQQRRSLPRPAAEPSQAGNSVNDDLESRISFLERRIDHMEQWELEDEEWKSEDREWKRRVEDMLRESGLWLDDY